MASQHWPPEWQRGLLAAAVLGVLTQHTQHGYALAQSLKRSGWGSVPGGTLYPVLRNLEERKLITGTWDTQERGPARKYYQATRAGVRLTTQHQAAWQLLAQSMAGLLGTEESNHAQRHPPVHR